MQKRVSLIIKTSTYSDLSRHLFETRTVESMAMAFFRISHCSDKTKLLVKEIRIPKEEDYLDRSAGHVSLRPEFMERCFQYCEDHGCHLLDIHTHPWSEKVSFSWIDDQEALEKKVPYIKRYVVDTQIAFMVFGLNSCIVKARIWDREKGELQPITRIIIL